MKRKTALLIIIVALALGAFGMYSYLYKPQRNIGTEEASYTLAAKDLAADYKKDAVTADAKYLNKTIQIKGTITHVADSLVTLDSLVTCGFDGLPPARKTLETVIVKGRCIGYDELFGEVKLDQCTIKE